ncbi:MAG: amidophosphoribosyltransferase [Pseudomonadota bacterium]
MPCDSSFSIPSASPTRYGSLHDECGLFGIWQHPEAIALTTLGLHAVQHRGQEGAGIVGLKGRAFYVHRAPGLVGDVLSAERNTLVDKGITSAIGHVRYSTAGGKDVQNLQPFVGETRYGPLAVAHNGNLTNSAQLRKMFLDKGRTFQSDSDTEVILHAIALSNADTLADAIRDALVKIRGAYSLLVMSRDEVFAIRDPHGMRPLVLGEMDDNLLAGRLVAASETCALDIIGARYLRDIKPGEMVRISHDGLQTMTLGPSKPERFCIFEYIYFMHPHSVFGGRTVAAVREQIGAMLCRESAISADAVVPVPDSGVHAAVGYAQAAQIPFKQSIVRSHYVGRTFIEPADKIRHLGVKLKLSVNRAAVKDKRIILVDDSIVRGTTMPKIVDIVRRFGAREVHVRISSPPFMNPCFYGIDTPSRDDLVAANHDVETIRKKIGADSLAFISIDGLYRALGAPGRDVAGRSYCDACFTGEYPISLAGEENTAKAS